MSMPAQAWAYSMAAEYGPIGITILEAVGAPGSPSLAGGGSTLYHGSDLASVKNIVANGINKKAARTLGGGDVFWATTSLTTARWFAQVNPAMSEKVGVVGVTLRGGIAAAEKAGIITLDTKTGAYTVQNWSAFNKIAEFFRAE